MRLVADAGATKTDWAWTTLSGETSFTQTAGFNPTYTDGNQLNHLKKELSRLPVSSEELSIYYYGAGCRAPEAVARTEALLNAIWPQAEVKVFDDLLGAARACCGHSPGIVCILGTGSNSMLYDGQKATDRIPNLGVLLGDEGSGAHIGKELVKSWFYREMPANIHQLFATALPGGRDEFIKELYSRQSPGSFLATFVKVIADLKTDPWVANLVRSCVDEFVARHVLKYESARELKVHFCGSIAWHFQPIVEKVLARHGLQKGKILRKPIEELFKFHLNDASSQPFSPDR